MLMRNLGSIFGFEVARYFYLVTSFCTLYKQLGRPPPARAVLLWNFFLVLSIQSQLINTKFKF
jgi:hypothetical protein